MTVNCDRDCICLSCSGYPVYAPSRARMSAPRSMVAAGKPSRAALPLSTEREDAPVDSEHPYCSDPGCPQHGIAASNARQSAFYAAADRAGTNDRADVTTGDGYSRYDRDES